MADYSRCGGYRAKGGRGKKGWYKGYWCDSSWELAWVIYQLEHGKSFERNNQGFSYNFLGKSFKYYPDFRIPLTNEYVEIKGYDSPKWRAKKDNFPNRLSVIGRNEIKSYIEYAVAKYGKNFTSLYEVGKIAGEQSQSGKLSDG
jgi:hypothetical protein